ncbi:MAG: hypothetical protein ABIO70_09735 [Pseudomonadota bacterium]
MIPTTHGLPEELREHLRVLARQWRDSPARPRPSPEVEAHWDTLIAAWVQDPRCPLLVRRSGDRGSEYRHRSGRAVVCVDNSPAHWTLACAIQGLQPSLDEVIEALESGRLPVVFALSKAEAARLPRYRGVLARSPEARALNDGGWKVCHIRPVGLRTRGAVTTLPIGDLVAHCRNLLSPSNMFLVPNRHGGFGELPEVGEVFAGGEGRSS